MKVVGLTGGIGSGKSTVAKKFSELGVPVYIADDEAKNIMHQDRNVKKSIVDLFGESSYINGELNRSFIADKVFNDTFLLTKLNAIVHPTVGLHFDTWKKKQKGAYVIKEVAILFESGGYTQCDYTILVIAPEEIRIQRILKRDKVTRAQILSRMRHQWDDSKKIPLADFVVKNIELEDICVKVNKIHNMIAI